MFKVRSILLVIVSLLVGIGIGGILFSRSLERPVFDVTHCVAFCFSQKEALGLLASIGIQNIGDNLPLTIYETDKTMVFDVQYPYPEDKIHYAVVPKKDIKDIASLTKEDVAYLEDSFAVMNKIVQDNKYERYRIITNGPGYQEVTYLHFHLVIDRD